MGQRKLCVVCGKPIFRKFDFCKECEKYKDTEWAKALWKIERRNLYDRTNMGDNEITFSDLDERFLENL